MIIAVDFDGTLHTGEFPNIGKPADDAIEVMKILHNEGHYLIIWTCRCGERLTEAINWLLEHGIPFHRVNEHEPSNLAKYESNARKVYAHLYVDDRQIGGLPSWIEILDYVRVKEFEYKTSKDGITQIKL